MSTPSWELTGDFIETCNCLFICSCSTSNFVLPPNKDECIAALTFHVEDGHYGPTVLDDLAVVMVIYTPEGPMITADWSLGLIIDERADEAQQAALTSIFSGQAGGPLGGLAPLITTFLGVETRSMRIERDGLRRVVVVPDRVDYAIEGFPNPLQDGEHLAIDDPSHPANARPALARGTGGHLHAFGLDWDDDSGRNNGHFAPFHWAA